MLPTIRISNKATKWLLYKYLNDSLVKLGNFPSKLTTTESTVPYYGHHRATMFHRWEQNPLWLEQNGHFVEFADPYSLQIHKAKK